MAQCGKTKMYRSNSKIIDQKNEHLNSECSRREAGEEVEIRYQKYEKKRKEELVLFKSVEIEGQNAHRCNSRWPCCTHSHTKAFGIHTWRLSTSNTESKKGEREKNRSIKRRL